MIHRDENTRKVQRFSMADIDKIVNEKLNKFEEWFLSQGEEPLSKYEKAILRTFIGWNCSNKNRNLVAKKEGD